MPVKAFSKELAHIEIWIIFSDVHTTRTSAQLFCHSHRSSYRTINMQKAEHETDK